MNTLLKLIVPSVLVLAGCAAPSGDLVKTEKTGFKGDKFEQIDFFDAAEKIEGERHKVVKQALTGYGDLSELRQYATKKAEYICYKSGRDKRALVISERTSVPPYIWDNFPRIELTFVCADDGPIQTAGKGVAMENLSPVSDSAPPAVSDKYDRLRKIKNLLDDGALTQAEFESEKKKILAE